jgi:hypothetical protein
VPGKKIRMTVSRGPTGEDLIPALLKGVRQGADRRWKDLASVRMVLAEMSDALDGYNATLLRVDEALTMLEARVREIHGRSTGSSSSRCHDVDDAALAVTRGWVRFDDAAERSSPRPPGSSGRATTRSSSGRRRVHVAEHAQFCRERDLSEGGEPESAHGSQTGASLPQP